MVDFSDTQEQAAFRAQVREFVAEHHPAEFAEAARYTAGLFGGSGVGGRDADRTGRRTQLMRQWREALVERGWIAPAWPKEYGGADMSVMEQFIMNEVFAEMRAVPLRVPDVGSTIMVHGSEQVKRQYLPGMIKGEDSWCQGYSEPGAGSDLASLQCRAVRDGDDFVINGQKIWTSGAERADMMFGLFRTDPDAPKHRGISYLLLSMKTAGISVRPLEQITGSKGFNEVFFEDVRVPAKNVVGEVNRGWYVGATHLDFERSSIGSAVSVQHTLNDLREFLLGAEADGSGQSRIGREPSVRAELADSYIGAEVARMFSYRVVSMQNRGEVPNYEASVQKVFTTDLRQGIANTAIKTLGLYGGLNDRESARTPMRSRWSQLYLGAVAETIGAGTSEIQRNVIATRGLGLPRG